MKKILIILLLILLVILLWWLLGQDGGEASFSGTLRDADGRPIAGAVVSVGGTNAVTDEEGQFALKGPWVSQGRWVLDVRRNGFAPISKVYNRGTEDTNLTTVATTIRSFDASTAIVARDNRNSCPGSPAASLDWGAFPTARFPQVYDANGNLVTGNLPDTARRMLEFLSAPAACNTGFQVSIPANGLVTSTGQPAQGQVDVELSTVDLYSPDGMPGDYTVVGTADGPQFMESLGAGTLEIRAGDDVLQLQKGTKAEIQIPVDPAQIATGSKIPEQIPLLRYDSASGEWARIGVAKLDARQLVYIGEVEHFSEFNADVIKTNPACVRFDASGITGNFDLVTTATTSSGGFRSVTHTNVQPDWSQVNPNLHAIYNLPPNDWVILRVIQSGAPVGTWVVNTGAPWGSTSAPPYEYGTCGAIFSLSSTVGAGTTFNGAGASHRFGPLPKHVSFLVNTSGAAEDVYPIGGTNCINPCLYLFSLFDTGANRVFIDNTLQSIHGLTLTPNPNWDVDVRINSLTSLAASTVNPAANFAAPGVPNAAQANTTVLRVAPRSDTINEEETATDAAGTPLVPQAFVLTYYILAGAPVTNKVLARIDYTTSITRGPWNFGAGFTPFTITGPDMEFYMPGAVGIPTPNLTLFVEGFGPDGFDNIGTRGQRPFLQNVTFQEGGITVFDNQTVTSPVRFMFDSGTAFTVISQTMATALGVAPTSPDLTAGCSSLNQANFVQVDSITIVGMNSSNQLASYVVNNAEVCVDVASNVIATSYPNPASTPPPFLLVDAIIGSNLFDQAEILWDGPGRRLGILP